MEKIITEAQLSLGQKECLGALLDAIKNGEGGHFSVIGRVGHGMKTVSYILAERLKGKRIAFITASPALALKMKLQTDARGVDAYCSTASQAVINGDPRLSEADIVFAHSLRYGARKALRARIKKDCTVISLISAGQELTGDRDAAFSTLDALLSFPFLVYRTETVIDIRDVLFASVSEKRFVDNQLLTNKYTEMAKRLSEAEGRELQLKNENSYLQGVVSFQEQILNCVGIPTEELRSLYETLTEQKARLAEAIADGGDEEALLSEFQDIQAEILEGVRERYANGMAVSACENDLKCSIEDSLWNRLDKSARSMLITARYNFESMIKADSELDMDYSGVCLLITKAVEIEASRRFFSDYKNYLYKAYGSRYELWPSEMLYTDKRYGNVKPENVFTLGSVRNIVMNRVGGFSQSFLDYASKRLFSKTTRSDMLSELKRDCDFIEKVRFDYRNPAAHTGSFDRVGATECFEYVIEVQRMLQKMIMKMDY